MNANHDLKMEYVSSLADEQKLTQIALSCPEEDFQLAAIQNPHLKDESVFSDLVFNRNTSKKVCLEAINRIEDENLLEKIIEETYDSTSDHWALANPNFKDEMKLAKVAYDNSSASLKKQAREKLEKLHPDSIYLYREDAIEAIDDDEMLYEIAKNSIYYDSRKAAVSHIDDKEILMEIVTSHFDTSLAKIALRKLDLSDWEVVERIFSSDDNMRLREYVAESTEDEVLLEYIALNDKDVVVRVTAIENPNFSNEDILNELACLEYPYLLSKVLSHPLFQNSEISVGIAYGVHPFRTRVLALEKIRDCDVLVDLALNDNEWEVRKAALANPYLKDENVLKKIASGEIALGFGEFADLEIKSEAVKNPNLCDEEFLKDNALNNPSPEIRAGSAINPNLKDKELLLDLAINEREGRVCEAAANNPNLSDSDLELIILNGFHYFYFEDLVRKIDDADILENIIKSIEDGKVLWNRHTVKPVKPHESGFNPLSALGISQESHVRRSAENKLKIINPLSVMVIDEDDVEKVDDIESLIRIVNEGHDTSVREKALDLIDDEDILIKLALKNWDDAICNSIVARITNQEFLMQCAFHGKSFIKYSAIEQICDKDTIVQFLKSEDERCRRAALRNPNLADEQLLAEIALNDADSICRSEAVHNPNLKDENILTEIAIKEREKKISCFAFKKISDMALIEEISLNASSSFVRYNAAKKVSDEEVLVKIALEDKDAKIRFEAIEKIDDQDALVSIAYHDRCIDNRCLAVEKITDGTVLLDIVCNALNSRMRTVAIENENFPEKSHINDLALNAKDWTIRISAVKSIDDVGLLAEIAQNDPMFVVRNQAQKRSESLGTPIIARPFSFKDFLV